MTDGMLITGHGSSQRIVHTEQSRLRDYAAARGWDVTVEDLVMVAERPGRERITATFNEVGQLNVAAQHGGLSTGSAAYCASRWLGGMLADLLGRLDG